MKLCYQYMAIFFNFQPTSTHLHPLQVENCDSNSRLVVDKDGNGKLRLERVKLRPKILHCTSLSNYLFTETQFDKIFSVDSNYSYWWAGDLG